MLRTQNIPESEIFFNIFCGVVWFPLAVKLMAQFVVLPFLHHRNLLILHLITKSDGTWQGLEVNS